MDGMGIYIYSWEYADFLIRSDGARKGDCLWKVCQTVSLSKNREIVNTKCGLHNEKSKS